MYVLLLEGVLKSDSQLPYGKKGIYFAETGEHTWLSNSEKIGQALHAQGILETAKVTSISLKEAADEFNNGDERITEITLGSK
jgi:hypothetical protein